MHIVLAGPRGFCAGVNMAIESLRLAIEAFGTPLYVYHEIVHNKWVVEDFRRQGVVFVNDLAEVPEGAHLLYSAHGVPPAVRRQAEGRGLKTIDATCPLVTKVHREAIRFAQQGYTIVLIGHAGHDEVIGTMGEAPEAMVLVQTAADVDRLDLPNPSLKMGTGSERTSENPVKDNGREVPVPLFQPMVAYLTQTTLSVDDAVEIIARLRQRFPQIVGPAREDICYATQNRQEAVRTLARQADVVLVVGSRNSSNSQRLAELARSQGVSAHLIDGPADIDLSWFSSPLKKGTGSELTSENPAQNTGREVPVPLFQRAASGEETVAVTAGASAPEGIVQECVALLQERFGASVGSCIVCQENLKFPLPKPLQKKS